MLDTKRDLFKGIEVGVAKFFSVFPITPNQWTIISVFFALDAAYFLTKGNIILAIVLFLIASLLDFVDGAVARAKNMSSKVGAYLDTIVDRYVEGILLFGMLFLPLPKIFLYGYMWIFLIIFGSVVTTYAKAAAKEKDLVNQELKGGLLSRAERLILILLALVLGKIDPIFTYATYLLIVIAILTNFTALQRINSAIKLNIGKV